MYCLSTCYSHFTKSMIINKEFLYLSKDQFVREKMLKIQTDTQSSSLTEYVISYNKKQAHRKRNTKLQNIKCA